MANLIENARLEAERILTGSYRRAVESGILLEITEFTGNVGFSKSKEKGDFASNHAMSCAKALKLPPRKIAEILVEGLVFDGTYFKDAVVAGPGFINFTLADNWFSDVLSAVSGEGGDYGRADSPKNERVMVEFVSANPTGPMTIGNARGGVLGDTLAAVLDWAGYDIWREFYINDEGNQVELFARSIEARYLQILFGEENVIFPEDGYHGDDIKELARLIYERDGDVYRDIPEAERRAAFTAFALPHNIGLMKEHLDRYRVRFDNWFPESSLHKSGYVADTVKLLEDAGYTYEKDGAIWLRNTDFGADKDEALLRANGFYTYYAVDIAYHRNKFIERGFDRVIDVWGADHHGHAIRFKATMSAPALGLEGRQLDFLITQMVRLHRGGETVKVSKRTGKALTLNDLLDEIGVDACRFFFNAKPDSHLEFDLDLAVRQDSENPVYYVQYAHARICSLLRNLAAEGFYVPDTIDASLLSTQYEHDLVRQLSALPEEIRLAAREYDPSRINKYLTELAGRFHKFYTECRIKGESPELLKARLKLADCTRSVLAVALGIIGVSAPDKM